MPSDVKIATAKALKGGIEFARSIRGGRRSGLLLVLTSFFVIFLVHRAGSGIHPSPEANPYHAQHPSSSSWWPGSAAKHAGSSSSSQGGKYGSGSNNRRPTTADKTMTIKPIAYIFPQFHPIPENDEFWGVNYTEWVNVKKITKNAWGIEVQQPVDEIGYYNLLDYSTRKRYAEHARNSGLHGFVYHHYWFGRPVMEKVLMAMLEDGQPDMPFILNWANEPWTARWDGNDASKVLMRQTYGGIDAWREHFDWLLPFFKHPNQIRVNGKVQFMVYDSAHVGDVGKRMYSAWRKWAIEEGLGGLDIIETRIGNDNPQDRGVTDAVSEFGLRSGGGHDGTIWPQINRQSRVYHRGAAVSWDNSPRHRSDGGASANIFAHPSLWKFHMVNLMRRIKLDPNPQDQENFLFINAFNEWGEGNVLEPSKQWGYNFSAALAEAVDLSQSILWKDDLVEQAETVAREHRIVSQPGSTPQNPEGGGTTGEPTEPRDDIDVCVVARTYKTAWEFQEAFGLSDLLHSLTAQNNPRWRAVVVRAAEGVDARITKSHVLDAYDPRVVVIDPPKDVLKQGVDVRGNSSSWAVVDWTVANLPDFVEKGLSDCGQARYLVVARSNDTYAPTAFDVVDSSWSTSRGGKPPVEADLIGLNFETTQTLAAKEKETERMWHERCAWLESVQMCLPATRETSLDLLEAGAVLVDLKKLLLTDKTYGKHDVGLFRELAESGWSFATPDGSECHMIEAGSYRTCIKTGRFWFDVPGGSSKYQPGCHSLNSMTGTYGHDTSQWDMAGWKADPFCIRLSKERYEAKEEPKKDS